jgi:hypothetical protein
LGLSVGIASEENYGGQGEKTAVPLKRTEYSGEPERSFIYN